ncbi:MAG: cupin domain-containing protein [Firmicutes bacterium]|nr:cupin domain-containing protein [Bacillota bacterium]
MSTTVTRELAEDGVVQTGAQRGIQATVETDGREEFLESIGRRIRFLRKRKGITLRDMGERLNLSASYLSQMETGKANVRIDVLKQISDILGVSTVFFFMDQKRGPIKHIRCNDVVQTMLEHKAHVRMLFVSDNLKLEATGMTLPPGASSGKPVSHQGDECCYVIEGEVDFVYEADEKYRLKAGDIINYPAESPHGWSNPTDEMARVLVVCTPATF